MTLQNIFLVVGLVVMAFALRSFASSFLQRLGGLSLMGASFFFGWFLLNSMVAGAICAASWLFLPWLEILTRVRNMRVPIQKNMRPRSAPSEERFPALDEITKEILDENFVQIEDGGWEWEGHQQFFRFFYKKDERILAAICLVEHGEMGFFYLSLSSRTKDGRTWTTWNYPFPPSLKLPPRITICRTKPEDTFFQIYHTHQMFVEAHGLNDENLTDLDTADVIEIVEADHKAQLDYNMDQGLLVEAGEGMIRYTWRGMFFLWVQFLRDLVRLS